MEFVIALLVAACGGLAWELYRARRATRLHQDAARMAVAAGDRHRKAADLLRQRVRQLEDQLCRSGRVAR